MNFNGLIQTSSTAKANKTIVQFGIAESKETTGEQLSLLLVSRAGPSRDETSRAGPQIWKNMFFFKWCDK